MLRLLGLICVATFLLAPAALAATFLVPDDGRMIDGADAIVIVDVQAIGSRFLGPAIVTDVDLRVVSSLKGGFLPGEDVTLNVPGGIIGLVGEIRPAEPTFWEGGRSLVFLARAMGAWQTWGLMLGKFDFVQPSSGQALLVRGYRAEPVNGWTADGSPYVERLRYAGPFLDYIQKRVNGDAPPANYFVSSRSRIVGQAADQTGTALRYRLDAHGVAASAYSTALVSRWKRFEEGGNVSFVVARSQPGYDMIGAVQRGTAAWTNDPGSQIDYRYGGTSTGTYTKDGQNVALGDAPEFVPSPSLGYSTWYVEGQHQYQGETFWTIIEGDIVVTNVSGLSQKVYDEIVTHELGHTLGIRHSDEGSPSSTAAVMKSVISGNYGAELGPWDREAAGHLYVTTAASPASIDVDGNGTKEALTDGLLIFRYLFGFRGTTLIQGAVGSGATRTTAAQIEAYIASILPALDVDGNGAREALTDGLLLTRYLFGFRGTTLIQGAIGAGATRTTAAQIEAYLATL